MRAVFLFASALFVNVAVAEEVECLDLHETNAAANAVKYHEVLTSLNKGDVEGAKEMIRSFQSSEILVLEQLESEGKLSSRSKRVLSLVRDEGDSE